MSCALRRTLHNLPILCLESTHLVSPFGTTAFGLGVRPGGSGLALGPMPGSWLVLRAGGGVMLRCLSFSSRAAVSAAEGGGVALGAAGDESPGLAPLVLSCPKGLPQAQRPVLAPGP
jgi:hypothetical protein